MKPTITTHKVNGCNEALDIVICDEPGHGGAPHHYQIALNTPQTLREELRSGLPCDILFQNGPIKEYGVNGVTQEALLAIVIHRLESFQKGEFACRENAIALTHLETAVMWLQKRTRDRMARGVEGTTQK